MPHTENLQIEALREIMKNHQRELHTTKQAFKDEYEKKMNHREEEITNFFKDFLRENSELQEKVTSLEVELALYKEQLEEALEHKSAYQLENAFEIKSTNSLVDKQFYTNLKVLKEKNENKQKEVTEKFDKKLKAMAKEHRVQISSLRKMSVDNKNDILNDYLNDVEYIALSRVEEQFALFEKKIRLSYEELNNRDKYILIVEHKYDMINEENIFVKKKISEEKTNILQQISTIQVEKESQQNSLIQDFSIQLEQHKKEMKTKIETTINESEKIIRELTSMKEQAVKSYEVSLADVINLKKDLEFNIKEKEKLKVDCDEKEKSIQRLLAGQYGFEKEINQKILEKEMIQKANDDLTSKLNDYLAKMVSLEITNKKLNESLDSKIKEHESKYKVIVEKLNAQIIDLEKELRATRHDGLEDKERVSQNKRKFDQLNEELEDLRGQKEEAKSLIKMMLTENEDLKKMNDKLNTTNRQMNQNLNDLEERAKIMKENITALETDRKMNKNELSKIFSLKENITGECKIYDNFRRGIEERDYLNQKHFRIGKNIKKWRD